MNETWLLILLAAILTYATRFGGYLVIARMGTIPPRLDAALNAVPAAVLTTIVTPAFVESGWLERSVIILCGFLALRFSLLTTVITGTLIVAAARAAGL